MSSGYRPPDDKDDILKIIKDLKRAGCISVIIATISVIGVLVLIIKMI